MNGSFSFSLKASWQVRQTFPFAPGLRRNLSWEYDKETTIVETTARRTSTVFIRNFMVYPLSLLCREMAILAGPSGERCVDFVLEELRVFRSMGGMATDA